MSDAAYPVPRHALIWLLLAMFAAIAPHLSRLPFWVSAVCLLCGIWRVMVFRERWALPGAWLRALLVFGGGFAVWAHFGTLAGPDAGISLLMLGFCFKLLETRRRCDLFLVVLLGYFVVAVSFLWDQSMPATAYFLLVVLLITAALLGLNQSPLRSDAGRTLKLAAVLLLQAVPLMVVLFLFVPRIGPVLALDQSRSAARTGLSDEVTPGDIARLSQSDELAFRVEFEGETPPAAALYWRALVLDRFDGRTWSRTPSPDLDDTAVAPSRPLPWRALYETEGEPLRYRVIMEPTDQRWLFALDLAEPVEAETGMTRDYRLLARRPVSQPFAYRVSSWPRYRMDTELPRWLVLRNLQLPEGGNSRTRALVAELRSRAEGPRAFVQAALAHFAGGGYRYTLTPPRLPVEDSVDAFLFDSRRGFCTHYAGALVFMLRAAGIPARMVAGYLGGEANPLGDYLLVHQFDAHAWVEYWVPGSGWQRTDPTAWVAPDRLSGGLERAVAEEGSFLRDQTFSPVRMRDWAWLNRIRLGWDYVNYLWHKSVLGYNARTQQEWLSRWFGRVDWALLGMLLVTGAGLVVGLIMLWLLLRSRPQPRDPLLRMYAKLCDRLARKGIIRRRDEGPRSYLARAAEALPEQAEVLRELGEELERTLYGPRARADALPRMRRLLASLS